MKLSTTAVQQRQHTQSEQCFYSTRPEQGRKKRHCWRMRAIPMGIRARLHITATFERNLPLYSRILRHVGRWLGMVNKLSMVR